MSDFLETIRDEFVQLNGKSADHVTHALKQMSESEDGKMVDGLLKLIDHFVKDKKDSVASAKKTYGAGGAIAAAIVIGFAGCVAHACERKRKATQIEFDKVKQITIDELALAKEDRCVLSIKKTDATVITREEVKMNKDNLKAEIDKLMQEYADEKIDGNTYFDKMIELTTTAQKENEED